MVAVRHQPENPQQLALDAADFEQIVVQNPGQPYSARKVGESIERLYATGRFADIRVDARQQDGGVVLAFETKGNYFVGFVAVRGVASPPGESQLLTAARLQLGQLFSEEDVQVAIGGLRQVLEDEGYFQAEIVPRYQRYPETQQIDIIFEVRTGKRAYLGTVSVSGDPVFAADTLIRQAKWSRGKPFTADRLRRGLTRIREWYLEELYLEASVAVAQKRFQPQSNQVDLELEVAAGTKVEVSLSGAQISRSKLKELLPIFEEGALDEDLLREGERNLRDYFQAAGYFDAQVRYVRRRLEPGRDALEYQVELGSRQSLKDMRITENQYFNTDTLRERIQIEPASFFSRHGRFSTRRLENSLAAIRSLYQSNGFPQVEVTSELERMEEDSGNAISVSIGVREGPQVRIGAFSITGNESFPQERLEGYINAGNSQPYSDSLVLSDRDNLLTFYFNEGFPEARFQTRTTPSEDGSRVDLEYTLEEGPREYVEHIFVDGLEHTRRGIVNRQLQLRSGVPLSQGELLDTQRRLYDLGIFSQVQIAVQNPSGREPVRNVLVYLREAQRYTLKIGLGAEVGRFGGSSRDVTDVEGDNEFSPNFSFDVTRLNVRGRPHTVSLRTRFSTLQKRARLTYLAPRLLNYEWLNGSASLFFEESRDVRTFTAQRVEGSIQFESRRSRATTWLHRFSFRRVTVDTSTLKVSSDQIPLVSRPVLVGMLSQTWIRDTRDLPTDAKQGMLTTVDLGIAAKPLGSETSFFRALLQNATFHRLNGRWVLARTMQFGFQTPFGKGRRVGIQPGEGELPPKEVLTNDIPIAERFFAGGGSSHRGFAVNQAGPRDLITGFALGGNALLLNTVELRFPVWGDTLSGVLFHDAGNVFASVGDIRLRQHQKNLTNFSYLSHAVGLGLRYQTPVGPVRFDLGYSLNPPRFLVQTGKVPATQTLSRWQVLFSIGQSF